MKSKQSYSEQQQETSLYELELLNVTAAAICVKNMKDEDVWLPLSLVKNFKDKGLGTCTVDVPEWLATEKELV